MEKIQSMYGYSLGEIITLKFDREDENLNFIPEGTKLRIVAIAPKVRIIRKEFRSPSQDGKDYFFNAVLESQVEDWGNRIRFDLAAIKKEKKK